MDKETLLAQLDEQFQPLFAEQNEQIEAHTLELRTLEGAYTEKKKSIEEYFDAIEAKQAAEEIISKGVPMP